MGCKVLGCCWGIWSWVCFFNAGAGAAGCSRACACTRANAAGVGARSVPEPGSRQAGWSCGQGFWKGLSSQRRTRRLARRRRMRSAVP